MRKSSQQLWTQGEALERAGQSKQAVDLFVRAAMAEEDSDRPVRAKLLWEQIANRVGVSGSLLERLASACTRGRLADEAFDYWTAAAARFHAEGKIEDAARARAHALELRRKLPADPDPARVMPPLARQAIEDGRSFVQDILTPTGS